MQAVHRLRERAALLFWPSRSSQPRSRALPRLRLEAESLHVLRCRYASHSSQRHRRPGADSLLSQCLAQLAHQPHLLSASLISRLSTDIAQVLLEHLIISGQLCRSLLPYFEGVHLWSVPLRGYPGAEASWLALLVRAKLIHVDVSDTQVRPAHYMEDRNLTQMMHPPVVAGMRAQALVHASGWCSAR